MTRITAEAARRHARRRDNRMKRAEACLVALALPTREGDAFLANYYAEPAASTLRPSKPNLIRPPDRGDLSFTDYDQ
jgi:hypothetical protein